MGWTPLGTQFCLELAFGVLLALALVGRAPLGPLFHRVMGTTALVPLLAAALLPVWLAGRPLSDPQILATSTAALLYPGYSGPLKSSRRTLVLLVALACCAVALVLAVRGVQQVDSGARLAVSSLSALSTGAVAGTVGLAMVLGHWYLTIPALDIDHLRRLNRACVLCIGASVVALAMSCWIYAPSLENGSPPLFGPRGAFYLGTRVAVGLGLPLLFAWMVSSSLDHRNTRSATGILYASTVLVLIGTAVSISLQDSYGIPL